MKKGTLQARLRRDLVDFENQKKGVSPELRAYARAATSIKTF